MNKLPYKQIDIDKLDIDAFTETKIKASALCKIRFSILPFSILLCLIQAFATILLNARAIEITATLISIIAYGILVILLLLINPFLHLLGKLSLPRFGLFNRAELITIFCTLTVSSAISCSGLTNTIIPLLPTPYDPLCNTPQRNWTDTLHPHLNKSLYITDPEVIEQYREGITITVEGEKLIRPMINDEWDKWWPYYWEVFRAISWSDWIKPLSYWMIFVLGCYGIFFSLTHLVLDYWSNREKIIFPLAKLPESLLPEAGDENKWFPRTFRSPTFWLGFSVSFFVLSYNAVRVWVPGLGHIHTGIGWFAVNKILEDSFLQGLIGSWENSIELFIVFTLVGLAFLLPVQVSFSIWFYQVAARLLLLLIVWMGYAKNILGLPESNDMWCNNPMTSLGAGSLFMFSGVCLYRCIKDFIRIASEKTTFSGKFVAALPLIGLVVSMSVVIAWLMWNGLPLHWAFIFVLCLTLLTLGLMRIVAEGGIYWFRSHASFFHFYKIFAVGKIVSPFLIVPLLPIYSVLFSRLGAFTPPNLLNSERMFKEQRRSRAMFQTCIVLSILVCIVFSLGYAIFLAHTKSSGSG